MEQEQQQQDDPVIWNLLDRAVALPPDRRRGFLDAACAGDPERHARVEALLAASGGGASWPQELTADAAARDQGAAPRPAEEGAGTVIAGRYKLLERIGGGGMGEVWAAEQTRPVRRRVALKLIKAGMDSRAVLARFDAERQALAVMDHPNIAKVLDGGTTERGRPFFAMEYVKGVPITQYCDDARLSVQERLDLFMAVCQAVQHAHQKGVIHRDLKPSNILVCLYDGRPVPKVIDFGLAKAVHGQTLAEHTLYTAHGETMGTPLYMSPEQANWNNLDIDTRSDVYSLGVILYELLSGSTPLEKQRFKEAAWQEIMRVIKEEEPPKPSARLTGSATLPSLAALRKLEPAKLPRLIRGELDWIVMKALEKDRARRYETADGLARDVERYLGNEPVQACPPSAAYRLRKLARRHRGPVAAAGLVLLVLVGGIGGTTWGLLRAEQQRKFAEAKRQEAVGERDAKDVALKAQQRAREDEARARRQAFAALRSMTTDVIEKKFTQGTVLTEDDRAFLNGIIAQFDAFAAANADDADGRALRAEGRYRVAGMRDRLGEHKEAEQDYDQAVGILERLAADFPSRVEFRRDLATTYNNRAGLRAATGRLAEAEQDHDRAVDIQRQLATEFPAQPEFRHVLAKIHVNRGRLLKDTGRLKEAEQDYDQAVSIQKQLAADFPAPARFRQAVANSHMTRGLLLRATGRFKEAAQDYDLALGIQKQLVADFPTHPGFREDLAGMQTNRSNLLRETGRLKEAKQDNDQALSIKKQLAADFPSRPRFRRDLAGAHANQGGVLAQMGQLQEAGQEFHLALSIQKQLAADFPSQPEFRWDLSMSYINRGSVLEEAHHLKEAEQDFDQAVGILKQLAADYPSRPEFRQDLAKAHTNRGTVLADTGRPKEAGQDFDQAVNIKVQLTSEFPSRPEFRHELAGSHLNRGNLLSNTGQPKEAEQDYAQALTILKQLAADFPFRPMFRQDLSTSHLNRGNLLSERGRPKEAKQDHDQALSIGKQLVSDFPNNPELQNGVAHTYVRLAAHQRQQGDLAAAKRLLLEGRPHHLAALKANPQNRSYVLDYSGHLLLLTQVHAALLEQEDAVRAAEMFRDVRPDPPQHAYLAASFLSGCIPIVARHEKLDDKQRQEAVQFYGDAAMKLLREAVKKGYRDLPELMQDADLHLRQRADFQQLAAELDPSGLGLARHYLELRQRDKAGAEKLLARPSPELLDQLNRQAYLLRRDGRLEEARELRARVVDGAKTLYPRGDARAVKYQHDYVQLLLQMQRHEEAEAVAGEALGSLPSGETTWRLTILRTLVSLYEQWNKPQEAERHRKLLTSAQAATRPATTRAAARDAATRPTTVPFPGGPEH